VVTPLVEQRRPSGDIELCFACGEESNDGAILFLHGVMRRWQTFAPLHGALGHRFQLIAVDFPGHGRSDRWPGRYRVADHVAATVAFLREHRGPAIRLYGHSLGAMVALGVAAELPERVRAAVLEDPPFDTMGARIEATHWYGYFAAIYRLVSAPDFRARSLADQTRLLADVEVPDLTTRTRCETPDGVKPRPLRQMRDAGAIRFLASCLRMMDPEVLSPVIRGQWLDGFDWQGAARRVEAPLLVLQADPAAGGTLIDEDAASLVSLARDATLVTLRGSGHNLHVDRTQDVLNHTLNFLNTLD
jgi:pimeloyl-ACP methyl ester carboxylesterase